MSTLMKEGNDKKYQDHEFTPERSRQKLVNKAVDLIHKHTLAFVACGVDCDSYTALMSKRSQRRIGKDAHIFVFRRVMKHLVDALEQLKWPWPTALIFDDNREYGMECYSHYSYAREVNPAWKKSFGSISFADDELYAPLQAADVLAWFLRKKFEDGYDGRFDRTIKRLLKDKPGEQHFYDDRAIRELDEQLAADVSSK